MDRKKNKCIYYSSSQMSLEQERTAGQCGPWLGCPSPGQQQAYQGGLTEPTQRPPPTQGSGMLPGLTFMLPSISEPPDQRVSLKFCGTYHTLSVINSPSPRCLWQEEELENYL